ncbi:MAG: hypothetical protein AAGB30_01685 [Pedobacter sp.]
MKNIYKLICFFALVSMITVGCRKDYEWAEPEPGITGLEAEYYVVVKESLLLKPVLQNRVDSIVWTLNGKRVANSLQYTFQAPSDAGSFTLMAMAYNKGNIFQKVIKITTGIYLNFQTATNTVVAMEAPAKFAGKTDIKWEVSEGPSDLYRIVASNNSAQFVTSAKGTYKIKVSSGSTEDILLITVRPPVKAWSSFTAKVFDYLPAPGQFVNEIPKYVAGDTFETMLKKAGDELIGEDANMVTLGGWGGYVVIGFDHTIVNVAGRRDFRIYGNAFGAAANPRPNAPFGGSCEPGIIMVAYDRNKNGKPDEDEWYEIKGSGNFSADKEPWYSIAVAKGNDVGTFRTYEMTFERPATETPSGPPQAGGVSIPSYIKWTDNQGQQGYKVKNVYHTQSYYPGWIKDSKITYKGIRLARNGMDESGAGSYYVQYGFSYGYVDNYPNNHDNSGIDIDWAIDKNGNKVVLPGIDFVKVYNGIDQENGWLGEASTEVSRGEDLHLLGVKIATVNP